MLVGLCTCSTLYEHLRVHTCVHVYVHVLCMYCYTSTEHVGITYALVCLDLDSEEADATGSGGAKRNTNKTQSELY